MKEIPQDYGIIIFILLTNFECMLKCLTVKV